MGGRGTYAIGNNVPFTYHTTEIINGVKALKKDTGANKLPEEAHSSKAYILLDKEGKFYQYREYDDKHLLTFEIGYHPEPNVLKERSKAEKHLPILHAHDYRDGITSRGKARELTSEEIRKYAKLFKGVDLR